jgi:thiosulfate/3-mercaptopyruvate sulfurtransferase
VTPSWLNANLSAVRVLDASWHLPTAKRDPAAEYLQKRIPGALRWDVDEIADKSTGLPHMFPTIQTLKDAAKQLRFHQDTPIVVYDAVGVFSSPRVWYTLKLYGANDVVVLDGGLPAW